VLTRTLMYGFNLTTSKFGKFTVSSNCWKPAARTGHHTNFENQGPLHSRRGRGRRVMGGGRGATGVRGIDSYRYTW